MEAGILLFLGVELNTLAYAWIVSPMQYIINQFEPLFAIKN